MEIEIVLADNKKVNASFKEFLVKTDQPVKAGGDGQDPSPFELFLASLGTCAGVYVRSFCDQRNISTKNIKLFLRLERNDITKAITKISIEIVLPNDFPEKYKNAVINAAEQCTVKKLIQNPPEFEVYSSIH
jgi:putative redox protein